MRRSEKSPAGPRAGLLLWALLLGFLAKPLRLWISSQAMMPCHAGGSRELLLHRKLENSPAQSLEFPSLSEQVAGQEWMLPYLTDCTWNGFVLHSASQMLFWGSLSKRQLPEDKLFLKTFGSCSKFTCQRKLCVPFLWEPLETFLLLLSAPFCFLKQVTIVFTRQEISSLASFFPPSGLLLLLPCFSFCKYYRFLLPATYLLPYHAAFQPTVFTETYFTSGNQWRGNFTPSRTATRQLYAKEHFHCVQSLVGHIPGCRKLHTRDHYCVWGTST